jgi:hypothetical protein
MILLLQWLLNGGLRLRLRNQQKVQRRWVLEITQRPGSGHKIHLYFSELRSKLKDSVDSYPNVKHNSLLSTAKCHHALWQVID